MDPREQFGLEFTCLQRVEQALDAAEIGLVYAKRGDLVGIPFVRVDDNEPLLRGLCVSRIGKAERRETAFGRKADGDDRADAVAVRFGDQFYGRQRAGRNDFRVGQYIGTAAGADVCACIRGIGRIGRIRRIGGIGSIRADVRAGAAFVVRRDGDRFFIGGIAGYRFRRRVGRCFAALAGRRFGRVRRQSGFA